MFSGLTVAIEKEAMDLKENGKGCVEGFGGKKGKRAVIIKI